MTYLSSKSLTAGENSLVQAQIPNWVPEAVQRYLTHTEAGLTIREVARRSGCHASTVMRQIRKIEVRRDDPLVDRALQALGTKFFHGTDSHCAEETTKMCEHSHINPQTLDTPDMERQVVRILKRLCEAGAVLAVAEGMETAVVVRETQGGATSKTASISSAFVSVMALNAWVECNQPARISRYKITHLGRVKLAELTADCEQADRHHRQEDADAGKRSRIRYNAAESPVSALSRRKDKEGTPFLSETLVNAAERLREDFELAQMGARVAQDWDSFLTSSGAKKAYSGQAGTPLGPSDARERVAKALSYLGPGLGDVALRCCCHLEGLESAEKRMGWSARSGKIVLRIALQRLAQFYEVELGDVLIG